MSKCTLNYKFKWIEEDPSHQMIPIHCIGVLSRASAATWVGVIIHSYSAKVSKTAAQIG